jgi:phage-related protein
LRLKDRSGQIRILYLIKKGDAIYFLHAFRKKTWELPTKEIDLVLKRLKEV